MISWDYPVCTSNAGAIMAGISRAVVAEVLTETIAKAVAVLAVANHLRGLYLH